MRTTDTSYGQDYWQTLDGGAGYQDSTMWEDLSHIVKEAFGIDRENWKDISGEVNVVDVGCAYGYLVKHLRRRGFDAWGLDFSRYALAHCDRAVRDYVRWFDLTAPDPTFFGTEQFRLVTCFETMEHIDEQFVPRAIKHMYDLLKPGGRALLTICTDKQPGWDSDPTHVTIRSHGWWDRQLETAGFKTAKFDDWAWCWVRNNWLFSQHDGVFVVSKP